MVCDCCSSPAAPSHTLSAACSHTGSHTLTHTPTQTHTQDSKRARRRVRMYRIAAIGAARSGPVRRGAQAHGHWLAGVRCAIAARAQGPGLLGESSTSTSSSTSTAPAAPAPSSTTPAAPAQHRLTRLTTTPTRTNCSRLAAANRARPPQLSPARAHLLGSLQPATRSPQAARRPAGGSRGRGANCARPKASCCLSWARLFFNRLMRDITGVLHPPLP